MVTCPTGSTLRPNQTVLSCLPLAQALTIFRLALEWLVSPDCAEVLAKHLDPAGEPRWDPTGFRRRQGPDVLTEMHPEWREPERQSRARWDGACHLVAARAFCLPPRSDREW